MLHRRTFFPHINGPFNALSHSGRLSPTPGQVVATTHLLYKSPPCLVTVQLPYACTDLAIPWCFTISIAASRFVQLRNLLSKLQRFLEHFSSLQLGQALESAPRVATLRRWMEVMRAILEVPGRATTINHTPLQCLIQWSYGPDTNELHAGRSPGAEAIFLEMSTTSRHLH